MLCKTVNRSCRCSAAVLRPSQGRDRTRERYLELRKLYVVTTAIYSTDPAAPAKVSQDDVPTFLLQISNNGKTITVSSRFKLYPKYDNLLKANLEMLLMPQLEWKDGFDGERLVEAAFALQAYMSSHNDRESLLRIPHTMGSTSWRFTVDETSIQEAAKFEKHEKDAWAKVVAGAKAYEHELYRAEL